MPVGGRNLGWRLAVGCHRHKSGLHQRSLTVRITSNEEIGWRHFVPARSLMQKASLAFLYSTFHAADHIVAIPERSEPVVSVGDDIRHRYRFRFLALQSRNPVAQRFSLRRLCGSHRAFHFAAANVESAL